MIKDRSFKNCFCNHISSQQKKKKEEGVGAFKSLRIINYDGG